MCNLEDYIPFNDGKDQNMVTQHVKLVPHAVNNLKMVCTYNVPPPMKKHERQLYTQ